MKHSTQGFAGIAFIAIFAVVLGAGGIYYTTRNNSITETGSPQPSEVIIDTKTEEKQNIANNISTENNLQPEQRTTYKNTKFGFSFTYPSTFMINSGSESNYASFTNYIPREGNGQFLKNQSKFELTVVDTLIPVDTYGKAIPGTKVTVAGQPAYKIAANDILSSYTIQIPSQKDKFVSLTFYGDTKQIPLFETVVSSITFTNTTTTTEPALTTYTLGTLSFTYPTHWGSPRLEKVSTRSILTFSNNITIESGVFYNQNLGRGNYIEELIAQVKGQTGVSNFKEENITVIGKPAKKISYTSKNEGVVYAEVYAQVDPINKIDDLIKIKAVSNNNTNSEAEVMNVVASIKVKQNR